MVDSVVRTEVVEVDVIFGVVSSVTNRVEDFLNRAKLTSQDGESTASSFLVQVSSKTGNSRDENDDLETFPTLSLREEGKGQDSQFEFLKGDK